jgi:hypothetical protein
VTTIREALTIIQHTCTASTLCCCCCCTHITWLGAPGRGTTGGLTPPQLTDPILTGDNIKPRTSRSSHTSDTAAHVDLAGPAPCPTWHAGTCSWHAATLTIPCHTICSASCCCCGCLL